MPEFHLPKHVISGFRALLFDVLTPKNLLEIEVTNLFLFCSMLLCIVHVVCLLLQLSQGFNSFFDSKQPGRYQKIHSSTHIKKKKKKKGKKEFGVGVFLVVGEVEFGSFEFQKYFFR